MQEFINFGFSGLTTGAIYAIAATGLVLTYTTTGVFNFAHGAMGMVAAFAYWEMRFGWHWPAPLALAVCLLILAPAFGALLDIVIMRRLDGTSETTRLVVTLSLLLALLGAALWIWPPAKSRPIHYAYEGRVVTLLHVRLPYHDIATLAVAALVAIGLRLLLYRTRAGVAMRASVDDRTLARLNGARPKRTSMLAWAIGASLAALAGVLIAPTQQMAALPLTLLIIDAYAAAMIGRLRSLPMTIVGALILGVVNDYALGYLSRVKIGQQYIEGFLGATPIVVLFVVLLLLPQSRLRGHRLLRIRENTPTPTWRGSITFCVAVVAGAAMLAPLFGKTDIVTMTRIWGVAIVGLSLIPLVGFAGQISLCQLSIAGIGMVVVAHLGGSGNPMAYVWAAVISGMVGAVIALPALRLSGIYLALSTAAFAVLMDRWIFMLPRFTIFGHKFDLFQAGSLTVNPPKFLGLHLGSYRAFFVFGAVVFALLSLVVVAIRRSGFGQRLIALKDSPAACATLGMNPLFTKMAVFAVSGAIAGLGGAIYGGALRAVDAQNLNFVQGLAILMVMVIAGINSVGAAFFCGVFLGGSVLTNAFPSLAQLQTVTVGFAGIGLGKNPNGFIPSNIRPRYDLVWAEPRAIAGVVAALVALWALALAHVVGHWTFAAAAIIVLALAPLAAGAIRARRARTAPPASLELASPPAALSGPLEWLGVSGAFTAGDIAVMDRVLALPDVRAWSDHGTA